MSFECLAPHYTWMEAMLAGPRLQRARLAWLDQLDGCDRILIPGVGHGHFLRALARRFPLAQVTSLDASAGMLAQARRRVGSRTGRLEYVHATLPEWRAPTGSYDAIITHFFLDCFAPPQLEHVVDVLAQAARSSARWLISDFSVPSHGWRRHRARAIHAAMYAFFRPITGIRARQVTPPDEWLRARGFELVQRKTFELGLLQSDCWQRGSWAERTVAEHCAQQQHPVLPKTPG